MSFVFNRITIALACLCVYVSFGYVLNVYKRAEWLIYALDQPALILGFGALVQVLSIPAYFLARRHSAVIETGVNSITVLAALYFLGAYLVFAGS